MMFLLNYSCFEEDRLACLPLQLSSPIWSCSVILPIRKGYVNFHLILETSKCYKEVNTEPSSRCVSGRKKTKKRPNSKVPCCPLFTLRVAWQILHFAAVEPESSLSVAGVSVHRFLNCRQHAFRPRRAPQGVQQGRPWALRPRHVLWQR